MPYDGTTGEEVGLVRLRDVDKAVVTMIGGTTGVVNLISHQSLPSSGYFTSIVHETANGPVTTSVPIVFGNPQQNLRENRVPLIVVVGQEPEFDYTGFNQADIAYRIGVGTQNPTTLQYPQYQSKLRAVQTNLHYEIHCYDLTRYAAQTMLYTIAGYIPVPYGTLDVVDSIGTIRRYATQNTSISDITEISTTWQRVPGFSIGFTVFGEIDFRDTTRLETSIQTIQLQVDGMSGGRDVIQIEVNSARNQIYGSALLGANIYGAIPVSGAAANPLSGVAQFAANATPSVPTRMNAFGGLLIGANAFNGAIGL